MEYSIRKVAIRAEKDGVICKECRTKIKIEKDTLESKRICPSCNDTIFYKNPAICRASAKKNKVCLRCACELKKTENYSGFTRICPSCDKEMTYKTTDSVTRANKNKNVCKSCSLIGKKPSLQCIEAVKAANTGRKLSEAHIELIKKANTGLKRGDETRRKIANALKGRKFSKETLDKMRFSAKNRPKISEETRKKLSELKKGTTHTHSEETKKRISEMKIGKSHSKESRKNMKIAQNARFLREPDWTKPFTIGELRTWGAEAKKRMPQCESCGKKEELHAHHIKPKCLYPSLALDPDNAMILCKSCHIKHHKKNKIREEAENIIKNKNT
jgi:5-methylcytosine-specific restriction endonuclease McrA